ncbi:reverse transcriptase [Plakobranchus ocellatus]|uniref:Reverse transcriptase n=1 Tax=Plakobranchus ocellatus TaxID=259542 RepID=A0AAV4BZA3_9GAST|nr:reverse transcriptase [Plakobranchus ocellatus]
MLIDEIRLEDDSKRMQKAVQQSKEGNWTSWKSGLQISITWNEIWHMAPLGISFLIRAVCEPLPSNTSLMRWGMRDDPTCPLCQDKQTTEHVLSSCKVAQATAGTRGDTTEC